MESKAVTLLTFVVLCFLCSTQKVEALQLHPAHVVLLGIKAMIFSGVSECSSLMDNELNDTAELWNVTVSADLTQDLVWKSDPILFSANISHESARLLDITAAVEDESIAEIVGTTIKLLNDGRNNGSSLQTLNNATRNEISFQILPLDIGRTELLLNVLYEYTDNGTLYEDVLSLDMAVIREKDMLDLAFENVVFALLIIATFSMGAELDVLAVKQVVKGVKIPLVGTVCQSICMPLLAYAIVWLQGYTGGTAMGLFMLGIAPGGGPSNMYTHLLGGNMSVSVTMTLISSLLSVALIPIWIYTLGTTLPGQEETSIIPFAVIAQTLAVITLPLAFGLLVQYKLPKVAKFFKKYLKVVMMVVLVCIFTTGIYSSRYVFSMFQLDVMLTATLLPYGGFILGGLIAFICKLDWTIIKTISIETGLQNSAIPFFVIQKSFSSPEVELAVTPVVWGIILTPIPLLIATVLYLVYNACKNQEVADAFDVESLTQSSMGVEEKETQSHSLANEIEQTTDESSEKETFTL